MMKGGAAAGGLLFVYTFLCLAFDTTLFILCLIILIRGTVALLIGSNTTEERYPPSCAPAMHHDDYQRSSGRVNARTPMRFCHSNTRDYQGIQ